MKFLFSRDLRDLAHIKWSLIFYLVTLLMFWSFHWFHESFSFGLSPLEIQNSLLGNSEAFLPAMPKEDLILEIHIRLFLYTMTILTLGAVFFRMPKSNNFKVLALSLAHSFLLLNTLSLALVRFVAPQFSYLKAVSFVGFQVLLGYMIISGLWFLLTPKRKPSHG